MLSSLFGDLAPQRLPDPMPVEGPDAGPAIALADDIVVDASPAAAIRRHFSERRSDLQRATAMVTLLDPSRLWASQVLRALADATAEPLQRLNLRERATLRTLAVIERALVPRRAADALRVYHADIRASAMEAGLAQEEIGNALAEGSQLTAVIVGAMQPHALVALLRSLLQATRQPEWRCPRLVFILPPGAAALRQRILEQPWPSRVLAGAVAEPLACAASVWNCVLEAWEAAPLPPLPRPSRGPHAGPQGPDAGLPLALGRLIAPLAAAEGVLACGIVALGSGDLLASQGRNDPGAGPSADLARLAPALCGARRDHASIADPGGGPDEILVTAGPRQTLLRTLPGDAGLGFVALLDRQQVNLPLLRFKLLEAERLLC